MWQKVESSLLIAAVFSMAREIDWSSTKSEREVLKWGLEVFKTYIGFACLDEESEGEG